MDPKKIDPKKHSTYVIERILDFGNTAEVKWLFQSYSEQLIKNIVKKSRGMAAMSKQFWLVMFDSNNQTMEKEIQINKKTKNRNRVFRATHKNLSASKPSSKTIRLRMPSQLLYKIKAVADQRAMPYQSYINTLLGREVYKAKLNLF